jgi:hypothetical protein
MLQGKLRKEDQLAFEKAGSSDLSYSSNIDRGAEMSSTLYFRSVNAV